MRALDEWVAHDVPPPASRYPTLADATLATPERAGWPALRDVRLPLVRNEPVRMDYGPEWARGIITIEPPRLGPVYRALVPAVDADGNDRAGVRMPEIAVPLATQTGWNPRDPKTGAPDALAGVVGSYIPFARTKAAREASGDPRLSIEERYADRAAYLGRVTEAALALQRDASAAGRGRAGRHRARGRPLGLAGREAVDSEPCPRPSPAVLRDRRGSRTRAGSGP